MDAGRIDRQTNALRIALSETNEQKPNHIRLDDAHLLLAIQDYKSAQEIFSDMAQQNVPEAPEAQYQLGLMHKKGYVNFADQDFSVAARLFEQAHNSGYIRATYELGMLMYHGYDDKNGNRVQDFAKAVQYLTEVADQMFNTNEEEILEQADANYHLATYQFTQAKNRREAKPAVERFIQASKLGHQKAAYFVADIHYHGNKVKKNYSIAAKYFKHAIQEPSALFYLGYMHDQGYGVPLNTKTASNYYQQAAEKKHPGALYLLGETYEIGEDVPKDINKAIQFYLSSASLGNLDARVRLGYLYYRGREGLPQDFRKAFYHLNIAAGKGKADAYYYLGLMHQNGEAVDKNGEPLSKDLLKAAYYFGLAASSGNADAAYYCGKIHLQGISGKRIAGIHHDYAKALESLTIAFEGGVDEAAYYLAKIYEDGLGTEKNPALAKKYLRDYKKNDQPAALSSSASSNPDKI